MNLFNRFRSRKQQDLIILDDIFPHLLSSFRIAEFNAYLFAFEKATVYSTGSALGAIGEKRGFREVCDEYDRRYPELRGRTVRLKGSTRLRANLIYFVFLHNARAFMSFLTETRVPFVFTLYPGGGFQMNERASDETLRRVCALPNLRKVITTQKVTREYLQNFLEPDRIEFIYGGVFPSDRLTEANVSRKYYRQDKPTFDICFVAFKYMAKGVDKGYPVFIEVAKRLARSYPDIRFHVVGPYDETDLDVSDLAGKIEFYGAQPTDFFPQFYSRIDLILAPTVPFVLLPGAFDGFPPGGCIEAGLCGVAVFCTDPLNQNIALEDGEEIVIVPPDSEGIFQAIERYYTDYDALVRLSQRGQKAFQRAFAVETQLQKRLSILSQYMPRRNASA